MMDEYRDPYDRIDELEAQVTRLQQYIRDLEEMVSGELPSSAPRMDESRDAFGLHPGDLDPVGADHD